MASGGLTIDESMPGLASFFDTFSFNYFIYQIKINDPVLAAEIPCIWTKISKFFIKNIEISLLLYDIRNLSSQDL